jgi:hypothetical protein
MYAFVSQVVSFFHAFRPKLHIYLSFLPQMLHAPKIFIILNTYLTVLMEISLNSEPHNGLQKIQYLCLLSSLFLSKN